MRKRFFALVLAGACLARAGAPSLMVLDFQSKGILDKAVLESLRERTQEILAGRTDYAVVPSKEARKRIFDQSILVPSRCDQGCFVRMADQLQAATLLVPSVEKNGNQLRISYVLIKGRSGAKMAEGQTLSDGRVGKAIDDALAQIFASADEPAAAASGSSTQWTGVGIAGALGAGAVLLLSSRPATSKPADGTSQRVPTPSSTVDF